MLESTVGTPKAARAPGVCGQCSQGGIFGVSGAGPGAALHGPYESLPTQDILSL